MKLAILIGVSVYGDQFSNLPACDRDVESMIRVVEATEKYDQILKFTGDVQSADLKRKISGVVDNLRESSIEEVFFYYTGHGDFRDNEFFYVLSDFSESKLHQTSLQNSEMDNWLRTLQPKLTIKVVDACHSGQSYVKDKNYLETHLMKTVGHFKSCYFLFSSLSQQYSYQNADLSYFTKSFIEALGVESLEAIRYKDIIDYISDRFETNQVQTPVFVTQATFTEVFTQKADRLAEAIRSILQTANFDETMEPPVSIQPQTLTLVQMIKKDAERYRTKEEVKGILLRAKDDVQKHNYSLDFTELYDIDVSFETDLDSLPKKIPVGEWLDKHKDQYFASVEEEEEAYQTENPLAMYGLWGQPKYFTKYRRKIVGFELTYDGPYGWIKIVSKPKFPNVPWFNLSIVLLLSKTVVRLFYFFTKYREKNWDEREDQLDFSWKTEEYSLSEPDRLVSFITDLQHQFSTWVMDEVKKRFPTST